MDTVIRKKYKSWVWGKILKRIIIPSILLLVVVVGLVLIAQGQEEEEIVFEPVTILGIEISVETVLEVQSAMFDLQGGLIEETYLVDGELVTLLEELEIDVPIIPNKEFTFMIELILYDFYHEIEESDDETDVILPTVSSDLIVVANNEIARFPSITFEDAGLFTYRIFQIDNNDELEGEELNDSWLLSDASVYMIVRISEDLETESLVAEVEKENDDVFVNTFEYDISEEIQIVIQQRWEAHVAQAYEDGYEYILNDDGEYERVAIYVPAPEPEPEPEPEPTPEPPQTGSTVAAPPPSSSGFPEDSAVTLSNSESGSYLALVNRHFRLPSHFSPSDLSIVSALNSHGNINQSIRLRATAARAMENMLNTAYDEGGHVIVIVSGYRSYATQTTVHNNHIATRGETEARRVSARPGHSEHQLGLAMDLSTFGLGGRLSSQFSSTPEGAWIRDNAHRFGFIVRYPAGREPDTGFVYEPWHLRYIGVDAATQMFGSGLILEEFSGN